MKGKRYQDEVVWIIGAAGGIGLALAHELAGRGARPALSSRKEPEERPFPEGAAHVPLDVTDREACVRAAGRITESFGRIDRVILLAAAYQPMRTDALDMAAVERVVAVNVTGAFNMVNAALPVLRKQGYGQLALCGSVAGYTGLPGGQPYSATKAAVINLCESLRAELPRSIDVKLISPGFVKTPMTDMNSFPMPMIITAEAAAFAIAEGLLKPGFEVHFPKRFTFWLKALRIMPYRAALALTRRLNG